MSCECEVIEVMEGFGWPEGPISLPDGGWAIADMLAGDVVTLRKGGGARRVLCHTGRPNGLALDGDGNIWIAESRNPGLLKVTEDGKIASAFSGNGDTRFLWPNDLCFGPDGHIYMTDSGITFECLERLGPSRASCEMPIDGRIFRIDARSGECVTVDRGLRFANGIAFGPGGEYLYVSETLTGCIHRYQVVEGRVSGPRCFFCNVMEGRPRSSGEVTGPDGMAFDASGNLYVAVHGGGEVLVLDPNGHVECQIDVNGRLPTNVAFGTDGQCMMLITECSKQQLLLLRTGMCGLPLLG